MLGKVLVSQAGVHCLDNSLVESPNERVQFENRTDRISENSIQIQILFSGTADLYLFNEFLSAAHAQATKSHMAKAGPAINAGGVPNSGCGPKAFSR